VDQLVLNDADGELEFSGTSATTTVSHVKISSGDTSNAPALRMNTSGIINNLVQEGFSEVIFASGKTLSITQAFEVPAGKQMTLTGAAGTLTLGDNMTLSGTLNLPIANTTISGGTVTLNGGTLQVDEDINFISDLAQQTSSNIVVANGKNLNYSGNEFNVGAQMLTLSGTGVFANTNNLTLNDPASSLKLNGISRVDIVSISAALTSGKLEIAQNATIGVLTHSGSSRIDIDNAKVLTLSNAFEIPDNKSMVLNGSGGNLKLENTMTLSGTLQMDEQSNLNGGTLAFDGGIVSVNNNSTISSAITHAGSSTFEIASGKRLTMQSDFTVPASKKMSLTGSNGVLDLQNTLTLSGTQEFAVPQTLDNGTLALNGGTLSVKDNVTISSTIVHSLDSTVDISSGSTLTHSGGDLNIGAKTLTLSGGGTFANVDQLVLNDAGGELEFSGDNITTVSHVK